MIHKALAKRRYRKNIYVYRVTPLMMVPLEDEFLMQQVFGIGFLASTPSVLSFFTSWRTFAWSDLHEVGVFSFGVFVGPSAVAKTRL